MEANEVSDKLRTIPQKNQMVKILKESDTLTDGYLNHILDYILLRVRFIYGYKEILHYIFYCRCLRFKHHNQTEVIDRRQVLYYRGNEKLERELDVVNLVRSIR